MKFFFLSISFAMFAMMLTIDNPLVYKVVMGMICLACAMTALLYDRIEASE